MEVAAIVGEARHDLGIDLHRSLEGSVVFHHLAELREHKRQSEHCIEIKFHCFNTNLIEVVGMVKVQTIAGLKIHIKTTSSSSQIIIRDHLCGDSVCDLFRAELMQNRPSCGEFSGTVIIVCKTPCLMLDAIRIKTIVVGIVKVVLCLTGDGLVGRPLPSPDCPLPKPKHFQGTQHFRLVITMGAQDSRFVPAPNVRERHSRALYINLPLNKSFVECFTLSPCECDEYNGSCWLSIVIDDLDTLEAYFGGSFVDVSSSMRGWMCKLNLLVKSLVPTPDSNASQVVSGYQILSLDFEKGWGGEMKKLGAIYTQAVPTLTSEFIVSSGKSGSTFSSDLSHGTPYSAAMINPKDSSPLVNICGKLNAVLSSEQLEFANFVVNRPHKFLHQHSGTKKAGMAYSPELGDGSEFDAHGCVWLDVEQISLPILMRLDERISETIHQQLSEARCFIQPSYTLVDHHNTSLSHR
jgi:hypothetical protein